MKSIIRSCRGVRGTINLGGDKSITHRALFIASCAHGTSLLHNCSECADCQSTLTSLTLLGIDVRRERSLISIKGKGIGGFEEPEDVLDCGNSGTTMRLLAGLLAGHRFFSVVSGDSSLRKRPMARVIRPLQTMGAEIHGRNDDTCAPLSIRGRNLSPISSSLSVASAQVKSSILFAGLHSSGVTQIKEPQPTRDHTERMLALFGANIRSSNGQITLTRTKRLVAQEVFIPGDISSAAYFLVLGALAAQDFIKLRDVGTNQTRTGILEILKTMGAKYVLNNERVISNERVSDITISRGVLQSCCIGGDLVPRLIDEIPIIAVLATQAHGKTLVKDAQELRVKETDRIRAIVAELKKMGASIGERDDGMVIEGPTGLVGTECSSHGDHRIAMALTIAGLLARGETCINDVECVKISCPEFFARVRDVSGQRCISIEE